jgi:carbonic anhydrase
LHADTLFSSDKSLAVIGFMIEVAADCDTPSEAMTASLRKVGEIPGTGNITTTEPLDFSDLQSHLAKSEVFTYGGSLTTAPCDEGVAWNVVADPIFIDVSTFRAVKKVLKFNSRYTQNAPGHMNLIESAHNAFDNLL